mgnify:CR=1 FL=1
MSANASAHSDWARSAAPAKALSWWWKRLLVGLGKMYPSQMSLRWRDLYVLHPLRLPHDWLSMLVELRFYLIWMLGARANSANGEV